MFTGFMGGSPGRRGGWCIVHHGRRFDVVYQHLVASRWVVTTWRTLVALVGSGVVRRGHHRHVVRKRQERGPEGIWCHVWVCASDVKGQREGNKQGEEWAFPTPLRDPTGGVDP